MILFPLPIGIESRGNQEWFVVSTDEFVVFVLHMAPVIHL